MADVQNVVTLGIGSAPGSIRFFLTVGLDIPAPGAPIARVYAIDREIRDMAVDQEVRAFAVDQEIRTLAVIA